MKRPSLAILLVVLLVGLPHSPVFAWVTEVVDRSLTGGEAGEASSVAVDSTGAVHIASLNLSVDGLQYTTNASGSWETILLDLAYMAGSTSIAVDSADKIHISYIGHNGLKVATNASGVWVTAYVHEYDPCDFWSCNASHRTSIALDSTDKVHISYTRFVGLPPWMDYELRHAVGGTGGWATESIALDIGGQHSIAVDGSDKVHISYSAHDEGDVYDLTHATNASGMWVTETVDPSSGYPPVTVAVDSLGHAHISYSSTDGIKHATNSTGPWVIETVGTGGGAPSMAVDGSDNLHITYGSYDVKYATNLSGTWLTEAVAQGSEPSIALDSSDGIHISYVENDDLNYAMNTSGSWITTALPSPGDLGTNTCIALDGSQKLHISYLDVSNETVKYATNSSGTWVTEAVGPGPPRSEYAHTSIALDGLGGVHISYLAADGAALGYATNASGAWVTETVDARGKGRSSIAVDSAGKVHIGYGGGNYASNASGTWVTEEVDPSGGWGPFIALDSGDKLHICYREFSDEYNFLYATNASGAWVKEILDQSWGETCSIALDSSEKVHIAYSDEVHAHMYATNASGAWMTKTVGPPEPSIRMDPSIALDDSDKVHMSYRSEGCLFYPLCSKLVLKYATNASGRWESWVASDAVGYGDDNSIAVGDTGTVYISHHGAADGTLLLTYGTPPTSSGWGLASTVESDSRGASATLSRLVPFAMPICIILLWRLRRNRSALC